MEVTTCGLILKEVSKSSVLYGNMVEEKFN